MTVCSRVVNNKTGAVVTMQDIQKDEQLTRREVAGLLGLHQDSVTRALPEGLGSAVVAWGGRSKVMRFSRLMVVRWDRARTCRRVGGDPCIHCRLALEDAVAVAEHLLQVRHGAHESCGRNCGWPGQIAEGCQRS